VCADGFYEWQQAAAGGPKQPWYFFLPSGGPLALAALWEEWSPRPTSGEDAGAPVRTCSIITTAAVDPVRTVHHRMPVVLQPEGLDGWLDPGASDPDALCALLDERGPGALAPGLAAVAVGTAVNNPRNDGPDLIREVGLGRVSP
jgi:putative SOS response-associated peptidase YedK